MNNQAFDLITRQLERLEEKVDELIKFKYYFTGVAAVVGSVFGGIVSLILTWMSSSK